MITPFRNLNQQVQQIQTTTQQEVERLAAEAKERAAKAEQDRINGLIANIKKYNETIILQNNLPISMIEIIYTGNMNITTNESILNLSEIVLTNDNNQIINYLSGQNTAKFLKNQTENVSKLSDNNLTTYTLANPMDTLQIQLNPPVNISKIEITNVLECADNCYKRIQNYNIILYNNTEVLTSKSLFILGKDNQSSKMTFNIVKYQSGIKGDTGIAGPKGDKGDNGINGTIGPKGNNGEKGDKGEKGEKGDKGNKGDKGDKGNKGEDGRDGRDSIVPGPQGIQGFPGPSGEIGPQGIQGFPGPSGEIGPEGIQGIQGLMGEKGDKGDKGDIGTKGQEGEPGDFATVLGSRWVPDKENG